MDIVLDHTIVPAHDKEASARFFACIFGLTYEGAHGHFAPVKVNDSLTLDFDNADAFESHHYAFFVSDDQFDAALGRVKEAGLAWEGSRRPVSRSAAGPAPARTASSTLARAAAASTSTTPTATSWSS